MSSWHTQQKCAALLCLGSLELLDSLGLALYFDKQHLTSAGAFYLWPYLCTFFRSNGLFGTSSHKNWQKLERNGFNLL